MIRSMLLCCVLLAVACTEPVGEPPAPVNLSGDEIGYFCHMTVVNHNGPKGQIFVAGQDLPLWFTSVRDTLVFTRLPDEPRKILAVYVNDMGRADWDQPQPDTWIDATTAHYVVGSNRVGGMGEPELVPFIDPQQAEAFASRHGGRLLRYDDIPDQALFSTLQGDGEGRFGM